MWYRPLNESSIATPSILLFPDRIEANIQRMIKMAGSPHRLRPHVKTHKISEVIRLQLQQGIKKFKCATLAEAAMVAEAGGEDILLAYPLFGPAIGQWFQLQDRFPRSRLSFTIDSDEAIDHLPAFKGRGERQLDIFVDIDNGMHRTGIEAISARPLIHRISDNNKFNFRGLHIYDGHIHELDPKKRKTHCDRDFEEVISLKADLEQSGIEVSELACGGTPTFPIHAGYAGRTLCPGTPLLWDAGYRSALPDLDFQPAAVVAGRVISKTADRLCLDLGYKSIASEMAHPRLFFLELETGGIINHSEEHLVLSCKSDHLSRGELVYALPSHVCPSIALHEKVYVVRDQEVKETWDVVARNRSYPI